MADLPALAAIRSESWGTPDYWERRIASYSSGELNPQHALPPRVVYVAEQGATPVGLVAGHLTTRHRCDGELEWIDVSRLHRRAGVATELLRLLAAWFVAHHARRVCVDVDPSNAVARQFYARHGAIDLHPHWMVWDDIGRSF